MGARSAWIALVAGALMTLAPAGHGTWAAGKTATPTLVVEQPEMAFEDREPGAHLEYVFHVKNTGSAPLVKAELLPDEPVSAAEGEPSPAEHRIRVSIPPDAATRELAARVIVHTSSARRPVVTTEVHAHPMGWVIALPAQLYFDETP